MKIENVLIPTVLRPISATIHFPEKMTHKLMILCPGFLDSKDYLGLVRLAELMASKHGYTVVRFDPTGTWLSGGGNIADYTTTQYLADIRTVIEYMQKKHRYSHIALGGHSRGGTTALLYAARYNSLHMVFGIMPSARKDFEEVLKVRWEKDGHRRHVRDLPYDRTMSTSVDVPYTYLLDLERYDVVQESAQIKIPVFLFAGELDTSCPPHTVAELAGGYDSHMYVIPGVEHNYRLSVKQINIVNKYIEGVLMEYYSR